MERAAARNRGNGVARGEMPTKARKTPVEVRAPGSAADGSGTGVKSNGRGASGGGGTGVFQAMCPAQVLLGRIADKWTVLVLHKLEGGTKRYGELKREIGGVSQKMLTQTLRKLEEDGLVERKVFAVIPPRVEYSLTELARTLAGPLKGLCEWAMANSDAVLRMGTARSGKGGGKRAGNVEASGG